MSCLKLHTVALEGVDSRVLTTWGLTVWAALWYNQGQEESRTMW